MLRSIRHRLADRAHQAFAAAQALESSAAHTPTGASALRVFSDQYTSWRAAAARRDRRYRLYLLAERALATSGRVYPDRPAADSDPLIERGRLRYALTGTELAVRTPGTEPAGERVHHVTLQPTAPRLARRLPDRHSARDHGRVRVHARPRRAPRPARHPRRPAPRAAHADRSRPQARLPHLNSRSDRGGPARAPYLHAMSTPIEPWRQMPEQALYLDDRHSPYITTWTWVRTVEEAIAYLTAHGPVENLGCDHDLGHGQTKGHALIEWIAANDCWPTGAIQAHSGSTEGRRAVGALVEASGLYEPAFDHPLGPLYIRKAA